MIAFFTAALIFAPFIYLDNGYFTFYGDFNAQQIPFYQMCHDAVRTGNFGWNWSTDLGVNFISSYTFYLLGSPFFWITVPFPSSWIPYFMAPLLVLKFACAALTAYLYIRRFTRTPEAARLGGLLYAFCGFSVYNIFFNHFHEAIIFFPLLLLSFELLITENRRGLFAVCVFLSAGINYFFFYGMVVFTVIYFIIRLCSKAIKISVGRFILLILEAVIGLAATSLILLPTVMALLGNGRISHINLGWNAIMYGKEQIYLNIFECFFFPPDLPARPVFFPGAEVKWSSLGGWLPLFGVIGVFAYCGKNKGSWLKRIICTSIVFALFPILNSSFTAFNVAYYARWFFMPILMMCLATVMSLEDREMDFSSAVKWTAFITLAFTLVIGFFPQLQNGKIIFGLYTDSGNSEMYTKRFWISCAIALVALGLAAFMVLVIKKRDKAFMNLAMALVCLISVFYSFVFIAGGRIHAYKQEVTIDALIEGELNLPGDKNNYRIDLYESPDNTGMYLGYNSINAFHSIVPQSVTDFYEFIGEQRSVASRPTTKTPAIRDLLSVKYLLNLENEKSFENEEGECEMPAYKYLTTQNNFKIYENENYIPYGFAYDKYITRTDCEAYSSSERADIMLKAVVLDDEEAKKCLDVLKPFDKSKEIYFIKEETAEDCKALKDTAAKSFSVENDKFTALVESDKPTLYFFSVPYEEGWSATVNGKEAEIVKANIGFMAVKVGAGESKIEFTYNTPYLGLGIKISITAAIAFVVYILACLIMKKHRKVPEYPEGEQLIARYAEYDVADMMTEQTDEITASSLDSIADELGKQYPVSAPNDEFGQGFIINIDIGEEDT
ncbi:MAG: YfhO family protein [Clostridiales bacterium]|nr:YfhO family protein [Candidatus Equinaster intestinalis]